MRYIGGQHILKKSVTYFNVHTKSLPKKSVTFVYMYTQQSQYKQSPLPWVNMHVQADHIKPVTSE